MDLCWSGRLLSSSLAGLVDGIAAKTAAAVCFRSFSSRPPASSCSCKVGGVRPMCLLQHQHRPWIALHPQAQKEFPPKFPYGTDRGCPISARRGSTVSYYLLNGITRRTDTPVVRFYSPFPAPASSRMDSTYTHRERRYISVVSVSFNVFLDATGIILPRGALACDDTASTGRAGRAAF